LNFDDTQNIKEYLKINHSYKTFTTALLVEQDEGFSDGKENKYFLYSAELQHNDKDKFKNNIYILFSIDKDIVNYRSNRGKLPTDYVRIINYGQNPRNNLKGGNPQLNTAYRVPDIDESFNDYNEQLNRNFKEDSFKNLFSSEDFDKILSLNAQIKIILEKTQKQRVNRRQEVNLNPGIDLFEIEEGIFYEFSEYWKKELCSLLIKTRVNDYKENKDGSRAKIDGKYLEKVNWEEYLNDFRITNIAKNNLQKMNPKDISSLFISREKVDNQLTSEQIQTRSKFLLCLYIFITEEMHAADKTYFDKLYKSLDISKTELSNDIKSFGIEESERRQKRLEESDIPKEDRRIRTNLNPISKPKDMLSPEFKSNREALIYLTLFIRNIGFNKMQKKIETVKENTIRAHFFNLKNNNYIHNPPKKLNPLYEITNEGITFLLE
tara:strand:+ start:135 stop:1442 length:1308 start_codon:yes stop_codon:yes gene_type:complete